MKNNPLILMDNEVKVGDQAPDVELLDNNLSPVKLSSYRGKVCIISLVPSLDTPICDIETRRFNEEAGNLGSEVVVPPLHSCHYKYFQLSLNGRYTVVGCLVEKQLKTILSLLAFLLTVTLTMMTASVVHGERVFPEKWYRGKWCNREMGEVEVVLRDKTLCDCLTSTHAVEIVFADKWVEAIGKSLFYSLQTDKKPGIVLIMESLKDEEYWIKLKNTIEHFDLKIDAWAMGAGYARLEELREGLEVLKSELASKFDEYNSLKAEGYSAENLSGRWEIIEKLKMKISEEEARIKEKIRFETENE